MNINVFISSTFNDMQAERDYICKKIIPKLRDELAQYQVNVNVTDLRWGVDTLTVDENEREAKVLHVCVDALRNTKPYFIALIGHRYGWVPSFEKINNIKLTLNQEFQDALGELEHAISVTEMEIRLGAIGNENLLQHSFFCFRSDESYEGMTDEYKQQYIDDYSPDSRQKDNRCFLESLTTRIKDICDRANLKNHIINYKAKWDSKKNIFTQLENFGDELYDRILDDVKQKINRANQQVDDVIQQDSEELLFSNFIASHIDGFVGRQENIDDIVNFFVDSRNLKEILGGKTGLFLTGHSGSGKSSLFCKIYTRLKELSKSQSFYILAHAAGISQKSVSADFMINKWCHQMARTLGEESILDDNNLMRYKNILDVFVQTLSRIQAKGYYPIILIDSLDSFEQDRIIKEFKFIPYQIPFLCTTLPGYAEHLVKEHPNYIIRNLDAFEESDARLLINSILNKNFKNLPGIEEQLLCIKRENGSPAYQSPMWLRMALAILLELGEEDFREIHKINVQREDEKIFIYLCQTIQSFPAETEELFHYFVNLTCQYFDSVLTRKALTYIAIAQYGIKEDTLANLLGKQWDQLEFNSIRFWLRDFIKCNNEDHRWFFTHSILRKTMTKSRHWFVKKCQNKFFKYLILNANEKNVDGMRELSYQFVKHQKINLLHSNSQKLSEVFPDVFLQILIKNETAAKYFIKRYVDRFYLDVDLIETLIETISYEYHNHPQLLPTDRFDRELIEYCISRFDNEILFNSLEAVDAYFKILSIKGKYIFNDDSSYYFDTLKNYIVFFDQMLESYHILKKHYGENFYFDALELKFSWQRCITCYRQLYKYDDKYKEGLLNCISAYINELVCLGYPLIFFKNVAWFFDKNGSFVYKFELSTDEKIKILQQIQKQTLILLHDIDPNSIIYQKVLAEAKGLIDYYIKCFRTEERVSKTSLMEELEYVSTTSNTKIEEHQDSIFGQLCKQLKDQSNTEAQKAFNFELIEDKEGKEGALSLSHDVGVAEEINSFSKGKNSFDDEIEYHDSNNNKSENNEAAESSCDEIIKQISQTAEELDSFLKTVETPTQSHKNENYEIVREKCRLYKKLAMLYDKVRQKEKANYYIQGISSLLYDCVVNTGSCYYAGDDVITDIIRHGKWLAELGRNDEQLMYAEYMSEALYQSYYHNPESDSVMSVFNFTMELYGQNGMTEKKIKMLQRLYESVLRMQIEQLFDIYEFCYNDLNFVRPVFFKLFEELKVNNKIEEAVVVLERWLDLCLRVYVDDRDALGFDDIEDAYYMLASLYDGTPTLVKDMKERNSIFLQDPFIMVCLQGKWGFVDHDGHVAIPLIYSCAQKAGNDNLSVCKNKWGYIDLDGKETSFFSNHNFIFDDAVPIHNSWGRVLLNGSWAVFSLKGVFVPLERECVYFHGITNGLTKVTLMKDNQYIQDYLLTDGESLLFNGTKYTVKTPNRGVIVATYYSYFEEDNEKYTSLYSLDGKELTHHNRYKSICAFGQNELTPAKTHDYKAGYLNRKGEEIVPFRYQRCRPFSKDGLAAVCVGNEIRSSDKKWGFINERGEEIVHPQYIDVGDFYEGLAWVCQDNRNKINYGFNQRGSKFGFINTKGEIVIPIVFDDVSSFYEGRALVWQNGKAFYINKKGEHLEDFFAENNTKIENSFSTH